MWPPNVIKRVYDAIRKVRHYLRNVPKLRVEIVEGHAFVSEPLDGTEGVIS